MQHFEATTALQGPDHGLLLSRFSGIHASLPFMYIYAELMLIPAVASN
jgi:hypothetical protein